MSGCGAEHDLISIDQALALIQQKIYALPTEVILLNDALNRYLAEDIYAEINLPLFSQSAVDGYAIHSTESIVENSCFELIGEIRAGQPAEFELKQGQAIRIFTGAKIPQGTTTVARQEMVKSINLNTIQIIENLKLHADIRDVGEEISIGQCLAQNGQVLSVGAIASLSLSLIHI